MSGIRLPTLHLEATPRMQGSSREGYISKIKRGRQKGSLLAFLSQRDGDLDLKDSPHMAIEGLELATRSLGCLAVAKWNILA